MRPNTILVTTRNTSEDRLSNQEGANSSKVNATSFSRWLGPNEFAKARPMTMVAAVGVPGRSVGQAGGINQDSAQVKKLLARIMAGLDSKQGHLSISDGSARQCNDADFIILIVAHHRDLGPGKFKGCPSAILDTPNTVEGIIGDSEIDLVGTTWMMHDYIPSIGGPTSPKPWPITFNPKGNLIFGHPRGSDPSALHVWQLKGRALTISVNNGFATGIALIDDTNNHLEGNFSNIHDFHWRWWADRHSSANGTH